MEYQVPQFIDIEDKIFGPLTLKQFIYIAGGAGLCVVFILYLPLFFGILLSIPVAALAGALAFYRINNKPFVEILEAGFNYYLGSRLYLWRRGEHTNKGAAAKIEAPVTPARMKVGLSKGKLERLAWSLDIQERPASDES